MHVGLDVSQHQLTWGDILDRTQFAEQAGFDSAWVFDHFKPLYGDSKGPCLEGWTLLAALAAVTTRIRLGNLVTGVTYRHPPLLAAEAVTVDHVSNGRLDLGVGAAWHEEEHRQFGYEFPGPKERVERLEEAIDIMRLLMTGEDVSYDGRYYQLDSASYRPLPVQRPYPPLWIGGSGEQLMLPLVGRKADVWHAFGPAESLARKARIVDENAARAGRDPAAIARSTTISLSKPLDDVRRTVDRHREAGFAYVVASWPGEGRAKVEAFASKLLPELQRM